MTDSGPDYQDLLARELVRRAAQEEPPRAVSGSSVTLAAFGAVGWVVLGFALLFLFALAGCAVALS